MPQISAAEYCVRMGEEIKTGAFWRDCFAELVATFLFVGANLFLVQQTPMSRMQMAFGVSFAWTAIGYGLGDFGGAHMNNAITFAALIRREICLLKAIIFWIMQGAGALCAAFFFYVAIPATKRGNLGNTELPSDVTWWQAMVVEAFATAILCFAFLGSCSIDRKGYVILSSLPVGLAVGLGMFLTMPFSGGSLNSMRSLGPAAVSSIMQGEHKYWTMHWVYWAGPMAGAFFAAVLYWIFDSVDAKNFASPYAMPSGTWSYNNDLPSRPQVKLPTPNSDSDLNNYPPRQNSKETLNTPDGGPGVYTVNGIASRSTNNGMVSAYARPAFGNQFDSDYYAPF